MYQFDPAISSAVRRDETPVQAAAPPAEGPLSSALLDRMQRYWDAANYLTIGQIYLQDNPLLREPLRVTQIKPRRLSTDTRCRTARIRTSGRDRLSDPVAEGRATAITAAEWQWAV